MKKLMAITLALVMVLTIGAAPVMAAAQKVDLVSSSTDPGSGFVVLNNSTGGAELQVSLKGAMSKADYEVLIGDGANWMSLGTMTTNGKGNANFHMNFKDVESGEYDVVVAINRLGTTRFITPVVTVTIK